MDKFLKVIGCIIIVIGSFAFLLLSFRGNGLGIGLYILIGCTLSASIFLGLGTIIELLKKQIYLLGKIAYKSERDLEEPERGSEEAPETDHSESDDEEDEGMGPIGYLLVVLIPLVMICAYLILRNGA